MIIFDYIFYRIAMTFKRLAAITSDDFDKSRYYFTASCSMSMFLWLNIITLLIVVFTFFNIRIPVSEKFIFYGALGLLLCLFVINSVYVFTKEKIERLQRKWRQEPATIKVIGCIGVVIYMALSLYFAYKTIMPAIMANF